MSRKHIFLYSLLTGLISIELLLLEYYLSAGLLSVDGYNYVSFTRHVVMNGWESAYEQFPKTKYTPPFLFFLMVAGSKIGLQLSFTGRLFNILGTILACQGILFICLSIYNSSQMAFLSTLIVISLPKIYFDGCGVLRDPLYWAELTWSIFLLLHLFRKTDNTDRNHSITILGIVFLSSLACLTRKEGVPFLSLSMLICFYFILLKMHCRILSRILLCLFITLFSATIIFMPYINGIPYIPGNYIVNNLN